MHLFHAVATEPAVLSPDWWSAFTRSAGLGGLAAVAAAVLALLTARRRDSTDRELARVSHAAGTAAARAERWWSMFRWLLEQPGRLRPDHASVILDALDHQAPSPHEREMVAAVPVLFGTPPGELPRTPVAS